MSDLFPSADCVAIVPGHSINTVGQIQLATRPGRQLWLDASGRRDFRQIVIRTEQATQYLPQAGLSMERERLVETRERRRLLWSRSCRYIRRSPCGDTKCKYLLKELCITIATPCGCESSHCPQEKYQVEFSRISRWVEQDLVS